VMSFFFQLDISLSLGISFTHFHHHLMFMLEKILNKAGNVLHHMCPGLLVSCVK
jgi:hypothetical protein